VLDNSPSLELHRRILVLLGNQEDLLPVPERLPLMRSLELLERLETPGARGLMQSLAEGHPNAWLTQEAKVMQKRMNER
jgi:hypothetical protein